MIQSTTNLHDAKTYRVAIPMTVAIIAKISITFRNGRL